MTEVPAERDMDQSITYDGSYIAADPDGPRFTPAWLQIDISPDDKARVQTWLVANGVSLDGCAGFDYFANVQMVKCRMYAVDPNTGAHTIDFNGEPAWAEPIMFDASNCPPIVTSCVALHRIY